MPLDYDVSMPWICSNLKREHEDKAEKIGYKLKVSHEEKNGKETLLVQAAYANWDSFLYNTGSKKDKRKLEELIGKEHREYPWGIEGEGEPYDAYPVEIKYVKASELIEQKRKYL